MMAKNSFNVDSLLKHKPDRKDFTYPIEPTYEPPTENETQAQHRERDLRNNKGKVDWDNECKQIAFKGPTVDGIPWKEADLKVRSLIYLSLGTEAQRIYQQRFPLLEPRTNHSIRIGTRTFPLLHTTPQHNLRSFPPFYLQTKAQRKTRKLPLSTKSPRRKVPPRICRRRPHKRHLYSFYD